MALTFLCWSAFIVNAFPFVGMPAGLFLDVSRRNNSPVFMFKKFTISWLPAYASACWTFIQSVRRKTHPVSYGCTHSRHRERDPEIAFWPIDRAPPVTPLWGSTIKKASSYVFSKKRPMEKTKFVHHRSTTSSLATRSWPTPSHCG